MIVWAVDESNTEHSAVLPTTITVVEVLPDLSTSISSNSTTFQPHSTSIPLKTTTTVSISETHALTSQIPTPFTSAIPSFSSTLSPPKSSGPPLLQDTKALSASSLNPGAIAGVVIACVLFFLHWDLLCYPYMVQTKARIKFEEDLATFKRCWLTFWY